MFPIVPLSYPFKGHHQLSPEMISNFVTGSSKLLVPGKVTASSPIGQGAVSTPIEPRHLIGRPDVMQISAHLNSMGAIDLDPDSRSMWAENIHWVRALRISDDCHSYNVQLQFHQNGNNLESGHKNRKLVLQAVRPIDPGQELLLWFSEEILAIFQMGFLTPANIQGQKKYVCTKCSALYESPNPLKLHITLSCGRYGITSLWETLSSAVRENVKPSPQTPENEPVFNFKLSPEPAQGMRQRNAMDLSVSNHQNHQPNNKSPEMNNTTANNNKELYRPYSESSAFKPVKKHSGDNNKQEFCAAGIPAGTVENVHIWQLGGPFERHSLHLQPIVSEDEAHIETLVSSLGKSKQGHICLYCGKCYSRKYGLKIHIRTHTGYKPLKCKFCMRPFGDPSNLNKHVRLHAEGNTPYKCDLCGKILVRRRDLDRHLKSRHMVEMHPGMNILQQEDSNPDGEVKIGDQDDKSATS